MMPLEGEEGRLEIGRGDQFAEQPAPVGMAGLAEPVEERELARRLLGLFQGGVGAAAGSIAKLGLQPATGWAYFVGGVEFFGGILLAIGLLSRLAAVALVIEFAVIVFAVKFASGFFAFKNGFEFELLLGLLCLAIVFGGGGKLSVDSAIGKEL